MKLINLESSYKSTKIDDVNSHLCVFLCLSPDICGRMVNTCFYSLCIIYELKSWINKWIKIMDNILCTNVWHKMYKTSNSHMIQLFHFAKIFYIIVNICQIKYLFFWHIYIYIFLFLSKTLLLHLLLIYKRTVG